MAHEGRSRRAAPVAAAAAGALAEAQAGAAETESRARSQWGAQRSEYETKAAALASHARRPAGQGRPPRRSSRRSTASSTACWWRRWAASRWPGSPIVEIVPDESRLLMNVRVKPADIGFLHPGQSAHVRVLAYDSTTHGQLDATLARVGADAVARRARRSLFRSAARRRTRPAQAARQAAAGDARACRSTSASSPASAA